jgi:hypothetical protein
MSIVRPAALAGILLCAISTGAMAAASKLQLIIGGEAYDGPPKFEVSFDGRSLGEGVVSDAIDTASAGRFADAADKTPYVQSFEFDIPEKLFKPGGEVRVRLINEAYGGEGSNHDRNLYLAAVTLNGRAVTVSGLQTRGTRAQAEKENELLGEFLVLRDGSMEGVSIGLVLAHGFSARLGLAPRQDTSRVEHHLQAAGLPTRLADIPGELPDTDFLMNAIAQDKKVVRGALTFILTRGIGQSFIEKNVDPAAVRAYLDEMR